MAKSATIEKVKSGVQWVAGTALTALIGWGVISLFTRKDPTEDLPDPYEAGEVETSNLSVRQALIRANAIYTALDGLGSNEEAVYRAFEGANGAAIKLIYNQFGVRDDEDMTQWFVGDLDSAELKKVRAIWNKQGVTPPF